MLLIATVSRKESMSTFSILENCIATMFTLTLSINCKLCVNEMLIYVVYHCRFINNFPCMQAFRIGFEMLFQAVSVMVCQ